MLDLLGKKMSNSQIKDLIIVGGGTAGWMSAAAIAKVMGPRVKITLIESDEIGIVGVGEATIPPIKIFNDLVRIDEDDFLKNTQGTIKLGIQFKDWFKKGHTYHHDFGPIGKDLGYIDFHHYWVNRVLNGSKESLWDYSLNNLAIRQNKFDRLPWIADTPIAGLVHAFHFDASLYAKYLRNIAENIGVNRIEGKICDVSLNPVTGNIESVMLENGDKIEGQFFIDCSGFRGLLIEGALKTGFEDFSDWLPVNRAIAIPCESVRPIIPYTRSRAQKAGWQWRIPLQHRTGNGHVYCSDYISDDEANNILLENLDGKPLADPRMIKFTTGRRKKFWNKNCIAIGLSSGFLEPLESTAIHLIQSAIVKLINLFPHNSENTFLRDEFNDYMSSEFDYIRDFIVLHYHANERNDEKFWNDMRNRPIPESLKHRIELFRESGIISLKDNDIFKLTSWLQVMVGQGIMPKAAHPFVNTINPNDIENYMANLKSIMNGAVENMPSHGAFIARSFAAKPII